MIKDIGKSISELENMGKNKINKIKTIINDTIKKARCSKNRENNEFGRNKNRNSL